MDFSTGILANSEGPDKMPHKAAFHQGLHCFLRSKQILLTKMQYSLEISMFDPLKCKNGNSILIPSLCLDAGPLRAVDNLSDCRDMSECISKGPEFDPGPVTYFCGD